ncbi:MAG: iron-containing alcohol dehydrogenase, partial [Planctomycetes bacterium]|nr:iron-containing alcohol dehydrogenase [Planctomycetota bacterium]
MIESRNGLQKSVREVFGAYHGWNGEDLDQRTDLASAALLEQTIDQLVETRPCTEPKRKAST